ncbi:MAG: DUF4836 family protein [Chitinophagaceae bacterium]|nr:DUF4836 family protein [Chitinophagaceae bacterium]
MNRIINGLAILGIITLVLSSCSSKAPKEARLIPKNAVAVASVNIFALKEKLEKNGITIDTLPDKIFEKDSSGKVDRKAIEELRTEAGINWQKDCHFFAVNKNEGINNTVNIVAGIAGLSNNAKFEAYIKKYSKPETTILKEKNFDAIIVEGDKIIAWDKEYLMLMYYQQVTKPTWDSINMRFTIPNKTDLTAKTIATANSFFTQKEGESIIGVKGFAEMFKTKADGYLFTSTSSYLNALSGAPLQIPKLEELAKDNYSASTLSFDAGKINITSTTYTNPALTGLLKKYAGPTVNLSLVEKYPSQNIQGIFLASFNLEIFGGVLQQLEVEGLVNSFLERSGISSKDLYGSLKGDIAVVFSDLAIQTNDPMQRSTEKTLLAKKPVANMLMNMPVGNKESFKKLMLKATELGYVKNTGKFFVSGELLQAIGLYVMGTEEGLIIASDSLLYNAYTKGATKAQIPNDVKAYLGGKAVSFYVNMESILKSFPVGNDGNYDKSLSTAKAIFKDIRGYTNNIKDNAIESSIEWRLQNEKQNSLVTLVSLFTNIAVDMRAVAKREKEFEEKMIPAGVPGVIRTN